jgi:hypothetical protein
LRLLLASLVVTPRTKESVSLGWLGESNRRKGLRGYATVAGQQPGFILGAEETEEGACTCQPGEVAQTLFPSELKIAALSTSPVPTRLDEKDQSVVLLFAFCGDWAYERTSGQHRLTMSVRPCAWKTGSSCESLTLPRHNGEDVGFLDDLAIEAAVALAVGARMSG